jgi:hypothetical protein
MPFRMLRIVAPLLLARLVGAADLPVSYTVNDQVLRSAVNGTNLTFTLHGDAACTSAVHTEVVPVESVTVISRLKRFRAKGAPLPPKTAELRHTLAGVVGSGNLYVQVTGTGITPIGGACQAQSAHVATAPVADVSAQVRGPGMIVPFSTHTAFTFTTEVFDTDDMFSPGAPTRLTVNTAGKYLIQGTVAWFSTLIDGRHDVCIRSNGTTILGCDTMALDVQNGTNSVIIHRALAAGDYVELVVFQDASSISPTTTIATDYAPLLSMVKLP